MLICSFSPDALDASDTPPLTTAEAETVVSNKRLYLAFRDGHKSRLTDKGKQALYCFARDGRHPWTDEESARLILAIAS
jgi:hypothetical protein